MAKVRKNVAMLASTIIMATVFQGFTLQAIAPSWLVVYCYPLGSILIFLCGFVLGQEWIELGKGFFAMVRLIFYSILLGMFISISPVFFGAEFANLDMLFSFLLGRGFIAILLWCALGMVGVFTGASTRI